MKLKTAILATLIAATGLSAFGQGFITFAGLNSIYDVQNQVAQGVGNGKRATAGLYDVAFLWTAVTNSTQDPLSSIGGVGSSKAQPAFKQSATNGVATPSYAGVIGSLLAAGFQFGTNSASGTLASALNSNPGSYSYNAAASFGVANSIAGATIQIVVVAWNASAGLTGILTGAGVTALGYSNPILYLTGTSAGDGNGFIQQPASGMNEFGVFAAPVPEPTTFALAGLGIASLLAYRRRNK